MTLFIKNSLQQRIHAVETSQCIIIGVSVPILGSKREADAAIAAES